MGPAVNPHPGQKWTFADYAALAVLVAAAIILFFPGLSLRSLWGSEGRWAVIAREMMLSGNYFLPTINGIVYFDKPLLSYWAIIPFSLISGVTEASARIPGVLAGIGTGGPRLRHRQTAFRPGIGVLCRSHSPDDGDVRFSGRGRRRRRSSTSWPYGRCSGSCRAGAPNALSTGIYCST
jgi:hypothetical protein